MKISLRAFACTTAIVLGLSTFSSVLADAQQAPSVEAQKVWSRATPPGASTGAVYLTLTSPQGDKLTGVSSPVAGKTEVHEMSMDGNVMRMRAIEGGLDLPAGKPVTLQPSGYHIMLEQLKEPLKQGQSVPVRLTFEKSAPIDVTAQVMAVGATGPAPAGGHSDMPGMPGMKMGK